jgi:hypothetical protein
MNLVSKHFLALCAAVLWVHAGTSAGGEPDERRLHFPAGVHHVKKIELSGAHAVLEGDGKGVSILYVPGGVVLDGPEPIIRNLTLIGDGKGTGILLRDTWSGTVTDVEIENYSEGMRIELTAQGRENAGGTTLNGWPSASQEGQSWGSRVTLTNISNVEITGPGDGIVLKNHLKNSSEGKFYSATQEGRHGEFFTATTIWGGHIYVNGRAVVIGDGVATTKIIGSYIDIGPGGGIVMEYGARNLTLMGVSLDLSPQAKKADAAKLMISNKSLKGYEAMASTIERHEIKVTKP